jgi:hypothetical protein
MNFVQILSGQTIIMKPASFGAVGEIFQAAVKALISLQNFR